MLDDPLSALDVRVARHVMDECIHGLLRDKCVILVTHLTHFFKERVTEVISIEHGQVVRRGSFEKVFGDADLDNGMMRESKSLDDIELEQDPESVETETKRQVISSAELGYGTLPPLVQKSGEIRRAGSIGWTLFLRTPGLGIQFMSLLLQCSYYSSLRC